MSVPEQGPWTHGEATVNGVRLHYVEAGQGPLVLLLHGFPEFWYSWRHQLPALAGTGFRALAPDLRGYNTSDKPQGVGNYSLSTLAADVAGLARHVGAERATIVGHDWGSIIAWNIAAHYPALVDRLIFLNSPPPAAFFRGLRRFGQLRRSWYMFFFQLPWLPERTWRAGGYRLLRKVLNRDPVHANAFTQEDIDCYIGALSRPGALTAAINYYRAAFRRIPSGLVRRAPAIGSPVLLIWGEQDRYLDLRLTEGLERWAPDIRVERIPDASHWIQNDTPQRVNELIIQFLKDGRDN